MSTILYPSRATAPPAHREIARSVNRLLLAWLTGIEKRLQRRRDRYLLARMTERQLHDMGIGRSDIERISR